MPEPMHIRRRASIPAVLLLVLSGLAAWAGEPPPALRVVDHPLAGRIWRPADRAFVSPDDLAAAASGADAVLLGETHDNPGHHLLQAWMVRRLANAGRRPVVAFEMLDVAQGERANAYLAAHPGDAAGLGEAVGWDATGWPEWSQYRPIAEAALAVGAPVAAASLARDTTRALAKGGAPAELVAALGLDRPLAPAVQAGMEAEIRDDHCGMLPESAIAAMVVVQRARDAWMARVVTEGMARQGAAVLIAGAGHVRADRGVPARLDAIAPGRKVVALAFLEVEDGVDDPAEYGEALGAALPPYDFVWFTPRAEREDPCEKWRRKAGK